MTDQLYWNFFVADGPVGYMLDRVYYLGNVLGSC